MHKMKLIVLYVKNILLEQCFQSDMQHQVLKITKCNMLDNRMH